MVRPTHGIWAMLSAPDLFNEGEFSWKAGDLGVAVWTSDMMDYSIVYVRSRGRSVLRIFGDAKLDLAEKWLAATLVDHLIQDPSL